MLPLSIGVLDHKDLRLLASALDDLRKSPPPDIEAPCHTATFDAPIPESYIESGARQYCLVADDEGRFYTMPPRLLEEAAQFKKEHHTAASILNIALALDPLSVLRHFAYDHRIEDLADELLRVAARSEHPAPASRRSAVLRLLERFARECRTPR